MSRSPFRTQEMRRRDVDKHKVAKLLFLIEKEQEKLAFFYESKYSRIVCAKYFPPKKTHRVHFEGYEETEEDSRKEHDACLGCGYKESEHVQVSKLRKEISGSICDNFFFSAEEQTPMDCGRRDVEEGASFVQHQVP